MRQNAEQPNASKFNAETFQFSQISKESLIL